MGVGYYKSVSQWSKGEYPGANNQQDDLAIIQNYGAPVIADDHGNANSSATVLSGSNVSASGVITTRSDLDVFQFSTDSGTVTINVNPAPRGADLDIQAKISDAQGNILATSTPAGLSASFNQFLSTGVYYLTIEGVGAGDLTTGYSDYASIGQYSITGTLIAGGTALQPPVASVSANPTFGTTPLTVSFSSVNSRDADGTLVGYNWNFGDGTSSTNPNPVHVYNSAGTFTAVLTVTDNSGLTGTASVIITAAQAANQLPVAVAVANTTSGYAPLAINFSSQGSYDPDGTIASYAWNFGDGTASNQANPSHTYSTAGNYTATLTVTDNRGATNSSGIVINVQQLASTGVIFVNSISVSLVSSTRGTSARAVVTVYNNNGYPSPNATVTGIWSDLTKSNFTGITDANGQLVITSNPSKKRGTFTLTVTNVSSSGYTYNPNWNAATSASILY
jgi:PKD repeat protein